MAEAASRPDRAAALRAALAELQAGGFAGAALRSAPWAEEVEAGLIHGLALAGSGDVAAAAPILARVAAARPAHAHPLGDLVRLLTAQGRAGEAERHFHAGLALAPEEPRLRLGFAEYLHAAHRPAEAEAQAREALRLRPDLAAALNLRGAALVGLGRMQEAIACFRAAIEREPGSASAWSNLGKALAAEGDFAPGIAALDRACRLRPGDAQLGLNRAIALLKAGRLAEGWEAFEVRLAMPGHSRLAPALRLPAPLPELAGRTVLLTHEEGFGDTLQFIRYAPLLARRGARVVAQMPPELARLVARVEGVAAVLPDGAPPPRFDFHAPLLSLPRSFGTILGTIPADIPYLSPDPGEAACWRERLAGLAGYRVGLVWSGAPRPGNPGAVATDRLRSLPLAALAPLGTVPGISFVSLQKGAAAAAASSPPAGLALHDPTAALGDFAASAALLANLDAVATVDTAVAHLAGGLGKPVFLLDRHDNCWRWLHGREDSPWYPTLRVIRQRRPGDWEEAVARLAAALAEAAARPGSARARRVEAEEADLRGGGAAIARE